MQHTNYKIGILSNSDSISQQELRSLAQSQNITLDQIRFSCYSLTDITNSDFFDPTIRLRFTSFKSHHVIGLHLKFGGIFYDKKSLILRHSST